MVDLKGQNLRGHRIYDVRAGGQLARFSIGRYVVNNIDRGDEHFILAYHAGTGLDAQQRNDDPDGGPIVPSQGLAIWHCIGDQRDLEDLKLCDLESPIGLWSYGYPEAQPVFLPPNHPACLPGLVEDKESGYDNYDLWAIVEATVSYFVDPATGERGFLHELVWIGRPCQVGCEYTFDVESSTSSPTAAISTATGTGGRIKVCPQAM